MTSVVETKKVIKGGSFISPPAAISYKSESQDPGTGKDWLGFRTVSRTPPPNAE